METIEYSSKTTILDDNYEAHIFRDKNCKILNILVWAKGSVYTSQPLVCVPGKKTLSELDQLREFLKIVSLGLHEEEEELMND